MTTAILSDKAVVPAATDRWSFGRYLLILVAIVALFIASDMADGRPFNGDPDDLLRAVQVRTLLATGNWYDLTLPMIRGPEPYVSPWSRLVDLPYAAIALALGRFLGQEQALQMAFKLWPPIMGGLFCLLAAGILRRIAPFKAELPVATLLSMTLLMPYAIWEFSPGRIDHHSVQILLLLLTAYGLTRFDAWGGLAVGSAVSAAIAVGLETAPLLAVALVAVTAAWWRGVRGSDRMLRATGVGALVTTLALAIALIAPRAAFIMYSDSFSAPYIEAIAGFGLLAVLLPVLPACRQTAPIRFAMFAGLGLIILTAIFVQYPSLRYGPYPMIDTLARRYWFDRIPQEMTALSFFRAGDWTAIVQLAAACAIAVLGAPAVRRAMRDGRAGLPAFYAVVLAALMLTLVSNRFLRLALAIAPLLLPVAVGEVGRALSASQPALAKLAKAGGGILSVALVVVLIAAAVPPKPAKLDAFDYLLLANCQGEDFSAIEQLGPSRLLTPPGISMQILERAPAGVSVSAIAYHRSSPAVSRLLRVFMAGTAAERAPLIRDFDYLAICRAPGGLPSEDAMPLFAALMAGRTVPGFEPVATTRQTDVMLFRIDKAVTR